MSQVDRFVCMISYYFSLFSVEFAQDRLVEIHKYIVIYIYIYKKLGRYIVFSFAFQRRIFSKMFFVFELFDVAS